MHNQVTTLQPAALGTAMTASSPLEQRSVTVTVPANFPLTVSQEEVSAISKTVGAFSLKDIKLLEIARMCAQCETDLNRVLDQFMATIDGKTEPKIFMLVDKLSEEVDKEKLGALVEDITHHKLPLTERVRAFFSKKAAKEALQRSWEHIREAASGSTSRLQRVVGGMEQELASEMARLTTEIQNEERLKDEYKKALRAFALATLEVNGVLAQAHDQLAQAQAQSLPQAELQELQDKVQAIESRALALEGTMTRLPSDQLVIRQLQQAGITTIQETSTTAASRFASIKMTLITINGALKTQALQGLEKQGAELDKNLMAARSKLMGEVVATAANAPGKNRLEQANQLMSIVQDTKDLQQVVDNARQNNRAAFDEARKLFSQARTEMLDLGKAIAPNRRLPS